MSLSMSNLSKPIQFGSVFHILNPSPYVADPIDYGNHTVEIAAHDSSYSPTVENPDGLFILHDNLLMSADIVCSDRLDQYVKPLLGHPDDYEIEEVKVTTPDDYISQVRRLKAKTQEWMGTVTSAVDDINWFEYADIHRQNKNKELTFELTQGNGANLISA